MANLLFAQIDKRHAEEHGDSTYFVEVVNVETGEVVKSYEFYSAAFAIATAHHINEHNVDKIEEGE